MVASNRALLAQAARLDEIPNESFDLLVALVALQAEQELEVEKSFFNHEFWSRASENKSLSFPSEHYLRREISLLIENPKFSQY